MTKGNKIIRVLELNLNSNSIINSEQYCIGITESYKNDRKFIIAISTTCRALSSIRTYKEGISIFETSAPKEIPTNERDMRRKIR